MTKIIDNSNFIEFCNYVNQINYRDTVEEDEPIENMTFSSEKAKQRYIELQKRKKQFNKNKAKSKEGNANFDLGNVIAKLSAKTNSPYNLTNIYNVNEFNCVPTPSSFRRYYQYPQAFLPISRGVSKNNPSCILCKPI